MKKFLTYSIFIGLAVCCTEDKEETSTGTDKFATIANIYKPTDQNLELSFTEGESGSQYFIIPYTLGPTSGDNVINGGDEGNSRVFTVTSSTGTSLKKAHQGNLDLKSPEVMSGHAFDHALRSIINRFDPEDPNSWKKIDDLESIHVTDGPYASFGLASQPKSIRKSFERWAQSIEKSKQNPTQKLNLKTATCPDIATDELIGVGDDEAGTLSSEDISLVIESSDYCLYTHNTEGLISEKKTDVIKTSIETSLKNYQTIYQDTFSQTKDSYKFQPLIIILPYGGDDWSEDFKFSAAFSQYSTNQHNRPTIYVASDQSKVGEETDTEKLNELFHSSIAHEMQHAVLHYYRFMEGLEVDEPQFDEGIAHLMEDVMGYGEVNFSLYPGTFINTYAVGTSVAFPRIPKDSTGNPFQRGGAHTFFYYLVSQKGGVSFENGLPQAGGGLSLIKNFVTGSKTNMEGLVSSYGGDWVDVMGGYFGALAIDGATTLVEGDKYSVQEPISNIKNTIGATDKTYGMRFHNHGNAPDLKDIMDSFSEVTTEETNIEVTDYQTQPLLLKLSSPDDTVTIASEGSYTNTGVAVIKIK